jgi:hypothetical protein
MSRRTPTAARGADRPVDRFWRGSSLPLAGLEPTNHFVNTSPAISAAASSCMAGMACEEVSSVIETVALLLEAGHKALDRNHEREVSAMADVHLPPVPEMRLELVPVPVSDVDRAKAFYERIGFGNLHDTVVSEGMRVVQFTPPGSACAIVFGTGMGPISEMAPGSVKGLHLVVKDIGISRGGAPS